MNDPNPVVVDPAPDPLPAPALRLAEAYPACFDWEHPRPLKINIHQDLMAAGHDRIAVKRALGRYCQTDRYRRALQTDAPRIDLQGQPAGAVTEREAAYARSLVEARATTRAALPPNATPLPKESLVPAHLILTVKFSELPQPLPVQDGIKIGVQTGEGIVTAILPAKVWRTLERATQTYPQWVAALSGALERFADGEIALKHPAVQVFEKKAKPAAASEEKASEPNGPDVKAPEGKGPELKAPDVKASAVKRPEMKASDPKAPNSKAPDPKAPAVKASAVKAPDPKAPDGQAAKLPSTAETPKGAAAPAAARPSPTHIRATISLKGRAAPQ
jgi:hypothetical protein